MRSVYITRLSNFLPNEPILNDEMETILGMVDGKPSRAKALVLRNNGIKKRYYAFKNGKSTHSNAQLAAQAVLNLFDDNCPISALQLLTAGTGSPDQLLPSHASMVHGELKIHPLEIISPASSCCSSIQGLKYAMMSIATGNVETAVSVGSEKPSNWMHASRFQTEIENLNSIEKNPIIAFEKDFLRWMLSDGAGAALLESKPNENSISLKIDWLEICSFANELATCMYAGGEKDEKGDLISWNDMESSKWADNSVFSLKQDTKLLGEFVVPVGGRYLATLVKKHELKVADISYFLPHLSSEYFKNQVFKIQESIGFSIPIEKWFYNLTQVGNIGSASPFVMLEELFNSGKLKKGDKLLVMVPESARFTYAYIHLTVV